MELYCTLPEPTPAILQNAVVERSKLTEVVSAEVRRCLSRVMPPRIWMPNVPMRLRLFPPPRSDVPVPPVGTEGTFRTNEVIIETDKSMTKIETKRILEAVYGLEIESVHSLNRMGKRRAEATLMAHKKKDFKRFYIRLSSEVELPNVPKGLAQLVPESSS